MNGNGTNGKKKRRRLLMIWGGVGLGIVLLIAVGVFAATRGGTDARPALRSAIAACSASASESRSSSEATSSAERTSTAPLHPGRGPAAWRRYRCRAERDEIRAPRPSARGRP